MSGFKFSYQIITSGFELIENLRFVWKTSGILSVLLGWSKAYFSTYIQCRVANFTVCSFDKVGNTDTVRP